jgi:hypothetical protein
MEGTQKPPNYHTRREHISRIVYAIETDIRTVVKWTGRSDVNEYRYVWQVLNATPGKRSPAVLDDMEEALRRKGYWIPYGDLDLSEETSS